MKKHICFLLITALLCSSLSGCVSTAVGDDDFVPKGGEMLMEGEEPEDLSLQDEELQSLSLTYFPNRSMNPLIGNNITNRVLFSLIYQGLFSVDRNNNPVPILCSYYQATSDNRNYTIYIETGARFSDGSPLTVADVLATYEAAKNSDYYGGRFTYIDSVVQGENNSVVFHLTTAYENLALLLDIPIVKVGHTADDYPLGTGPYSFQTTNTGARLQKVTDWWCSAKLPTNAETITLTEATSQAQVRDEFEFDELGLAISNPMSDSYAEYRCDYELWEVENGVLLYLSCNLLYSDWFKNSDVLRKALTYAIDRETLNEENYRGMAQPTTLITSPGSPYYYPTLASNYVYDPMKFLDQLGNFQFPRDEKTREVKKLRLLVNADDSARLRTARDIAAHLSELGIPCGVLEYGGSGGGITYQQILRAGTYDLYLGQTKLPPNSDLSEFFKGYGTLTNNVLNNDTLLGMTKEALSNSGTFYNLCQMVAEDGSVIPILYGCYNVYSKRGQLLDLQPARDNVFYYSIGKTMDGILQESSEG